MIFALTRRSIVLFLRERQTVFFSFLSSFILVALYFLFIAKSYTEGILESAGDLLTENDASFLVYLQMVAGVLVLNTVSLSVGCFATIARDFETRRTDAFLLTPAKPSRLLTAYFCAGLVVTFTLGLLTWLGSFALIGALSGHWLGWTVVLQGCGILALSSICGTALMLLVTALVKSPTAIGSVSAIAPTFLGFLCGIYMPYSSLGDATQKVGSVLPFTHFAIWMKRTFLAAAFDKLDLPEPAQDALLDSFSAQNIGFVGADVQLPLLIGGGFLCAGVFFGVAWNILRRRVAVR